MFGFGKKKNKPIIVENELGKFQMMYFGKDPAYVYEGDVDWQGSQDRITAYVKCDNRETFSADRGFARLSEVLSHAAEWDARVRQYMKDLAAEWAEENGLIEIWGSCDPESDEEEYVSQEEFLSRISIVDVQVLEDGGLEFYIDLDDMFTDHCLIVYADKDGNLSDSGLMG